MEKVIDAKTFQLACQENGISVSEQQLEQLQKYMDLLLEWNEKMNLTAITKPEEIWSKHFLDSILPFKDCHLVSFCDVGSLTGFPFLPLKIFFPQCACTFI